MTIRLITNQLLRSLQESLQQAHSVAFLTSFVMKSGIELILPALEQAIKRGSKIEWLLGDYLYVTQPEALRMLLPYCEQMQISLYQSDGASFHPKAYLFRGEEGCQLYVGSSNLSYSALTSGTEWNLALDTSEPMLVIEDAWEQFYHLFYAPQVLPLTTAVVEAYEVAYTDFHKQYPQLQQEWADHEAVERMFGSGDHLLVPAKNTLLSTANEPPRPRPAQTEALEALHSTYEDGYGKAMVVMATGLGKTYLAAFFGQNFKRILFIAHREEILHQAYRAFQHVMPERSHGFYYQKEKVLDTDTLFASVYTLSMQHHLEQFAPDAFDLIIIDEFHHAAATTYQRILAHFSPNFLLGITATPDRADRQDVYAICDGNVAYEVDFLEAIERGWLAPFQYYGIYDEIDYSAIRWLGQRYDRKQLAAFQLRQNVAKAIYDAWLQYRQSRTLAFCSSVHQADFLAAYFRQQGWRAYSLHSKTDPAQRPKRIKQLNQGSIDLLFTVDMVNEGTDIPAVDTLLFVRPTESLPLFIQQLGRGLRHHEGKEFCTIIDLVGNYRNADLKLQALRGEVAGSRMSCSQPSFPERCEIHLDTKVISLLDEMAKKRQPREEIVLQVYTELKRELGRRPTYLELYLHHPQSIDIIKKELKCSSWVAFLARVGELTVEEEGIYEKYRAWFHEVERTSMSKSYKMVLLHLLLQRGIEAWYQPVTPEEIAPFFYQYMMAKPYRMKIDWSDRRGMRLRQPQQRQELIKMIAEMPMTKWAGSSKGWVHFDGEHFRIQIQPGSDEMNFLHQMTQEICAYRLHHYFARKGQKKSLASHTPMTKANERV